jgi:hypothetical protein
MRLASFLLFLFVFAGVAAAQDTSFPAGPQYLVPPGSDPMFLHSIATPSISLSTNPAPSTAAEFSMPSELTSVASPIPAATIPAADQLNPTSIVPVQPNLSEVFWGVPKNPLLSPEATSSAEATSEIEVSSKPLPHPFPPNFVDTGVTAFVTATSLEHQGYGVSVGEVSSYFKSHKPSSVRTFTNADIERLPKS